MADARQTIEYVMIGLMAYQYYLDYEFSLV